MPGAACRATAAYAEPRAARETEAILRPVRDPPLRRPVALRRRATSAIPPEHKVFVERFGMPLRNPEQPWQEPHLADVACREVAEELGLET